MPICWIEKLPIVAHDELGTSVLIASGDDIRRERWARSLWRKHLESELRRLNEYEIAERADRGRIIPLDCKRSH